MGSASRGLWQRAAEAAVSSVAGGRWQVAVSRLVCAGAVSAQPHWEALAAAVPTRPRAPARSAAPAVVQQVLYWLSMAPAPVTGCDNRSVSFYCCLLSCLRISDVSAVFVTDTRYSNNCCSHVWNVFVPYFTNEFNTVLTPYFSFYYT